MTTGKRYTAEEKAAILAEIKPGTTHQAVADKHGLHITTIAKWKSARKIAAKKAAPRTHTNGYKPDAAVTLMAELKKEVQRQAKIIDALINALPDK